MANFLWENPWAPGKANSGGVSTRWVLVFPWSSILRFSQKFAAPVLLDQLYLLKYMYIYIYTQKLSAVILAKQDISHPRCLPPLPPPPPHLPRFPLPSQRCLFCPMCFIFLLNTNSHKIPVKKNHPSTHMETVSARSPRTQLGAGKPCTAQN